MPKSMGKQTSKRNKDPSALGSSSGTSPSVQSIAPIPSTVNKVAVPISVSTPAEVQAQFEQVSELALSNSRKRSWVWEHFDEYEDKLLSKLRENQIRL
ncbi:hypothetical protein M0R45_031137 [Rubus argutus]|uniref:Uncharacterized protein n=1 Tax=Rubus argutus TaxID=59490 RepID=A0AAW1WFJ5_RUBAR